MANGKSSSSFHGRRPRSPLPDAQDDSLDSIEGNQGVNTGNQWVYKGAVIKGLILGPEVLSLMLVCKPGDMSF